MPQNLNVGCGNSPATGDSWVNLDQYHEADYVVKMSFLEYAGKTDDGFFDLVNMDAFLEHLPTKAALPTVKEAYRILKPGGLLRITVPDFDYLVEQWYRTKDALKQTMEQMFYGNQKHEGEFHRSIWTVTKLRDVLAVAGFTEFQMRDAWFYDQRCIEVEAIKERNETSESKETTA